MVDLVNSGRSKRTPPGQQRRIEERPSLYLANPREKFDRWTTRQGFGIVIAVWNARRHDGIYERSNSAETPASRRLHELGVDD